MAAKARKAKPRTTVSAKDWTPDTTDDEGNPIYPEEVTRIDMIEGNACLVVIENDSFRIQHWKQLEKALVAYYEGEG